MEWQPIKTAPREGGGTRMFWFDKQDDRALFADKRQGMRVIDVGTPKTVGRTPKIVAPNILQDFTAMNMPDNSFWHVVLWLRA